MWLIRDTEVLEQAVSRVIENNPKPVAEFKAGKSKNFQFLLGQAMRETKGKADPAALREILQAELEKEN